MRGYENKQQTAERLFRFGKPERKRENHNQLFCLFDTKFSNSVVKLICCYGVLFTPSRVQFVLCIDIFTLLTTQYFIR